MNIFEGLTPRQLEFIRFTKKYREFEKGAQIFAEGDPAQSLFTVVTGKVDIYRHVAGGAARVIQLGPGEVFGEMGLLVHAGRTASARAAEDTMLFEITNDTVKSMQDICGPEAAMKLLQNLVVILSERLALQNVRSTRTPRSWLADTVAVETKDALDTVAKSLPKQLLSKNAKKKTLKTNEVLCREGDAADGFYFIHEGTLRVYRKARPDQTLDVIEGPTIAGQAAYFSGLTRNADIVATSDVTFTHFTGDEFEKMKHKHPDEALKVLFACAHYLVYWLARG